MSGSGRGLLCDTITSVIVTTRIETSDEKIRDALALLAMEETVRAPRDAIPSLPQEEAVTKHHHLVTIQRLYSLTRLWLDL